MSEKKRRKTPSSPSGNLSIDFHPYIPPPPAHDVRFLSTYQGTPTNLFGTMVGRAAIPRVNLNDRAKIESDKLTVFIDRYEELTSGLKNSTVKLLQAFVMHLSKINSFRGETPQTLKKEVSFHIDEYIHLRGLKDRKEARRQITEDLVTLFQTSMAWTEVKEGELRAFDMVRLCSRATLSRSGDIFFTFTEELALYLVGAYEMKLPRLYWELNDRYNPNASPLLLKISLQKKMNQGKKGEDILSVRTLLQNAPYIPKYEDMERKNEVSRAIISPLERDLDALEEVVSWTYCNNLGAPLTQEQLASTSFTTFIRRYVKFTWKDYPQTAYLTADIPTS